MGLPEVMNMMGYEEDIPFGWLKEIGQFRTFANIFQEVQRIEDMHMKKEGGQKKIMEEYSKLDRRTKMFKDFFHIHRQFSSGKEALVT